MTDFRTISLFVSLIQNTHDLGNVLLFFCYSISSTTTITDRYMCLNVGKILSILYSTYIMYIHMFRDGIMAMTAEL